MNKTILYLRKSFSLIELVVVMAILVILASILVPIVNSFVETANQAADNANARLIYNASAIWFSNNNAADPDLEASELIEYMGVSDFPAANSLAFAGDFSASVTASGVITVATTKPAVYNPDIGKLQP